MGVRYACSQAPPPQMELEPEVLSFYLEVILNTHKSGRAHGLYTLVFTAPFASPS